MGHADKHQQAGGGQLADHRTGYRYARLTSTLNHSSHGKAFSHGNHCDDDHRRAYRRGT